MQKEVLQSQYDARLDDGVKLGVAVGVGALLQRLQFVGGHAHDVRPDLLERRQPVVPRVVHRLYCQDVPAQACGCWCQSHSPTGSMVAAGMTAERKPEAVQQRTCLFSICVSAEHASQYLRSQGEHTSTAAATLAMVVDISW